MSRPQGGPQPLVTVAIPVYNGESFLREAIESVLEQDYPRLVLLVVDNASTDGTPSVVGSFHDHRLVYARYAEHVSMAENWNRAVARAQGEYLIFLGADDTLIPGGVSRLVEGARREPGCCMVFGRAKRVLEGTTRRPLWRPISVAPADVIRDLEQHILVRGLDFGIVGAMLRRDPALLHFDTAMGGADDLDLFLRLAETGEPAVSIAATTTQIRLHEEADSNDVARMWSDTLRVLMTHAQASCRARLYHHRIGRVTLWLVAFLSAEGDRQRALASIGEVRLFLPRHVIPFLRTIAVIPFLANLVVAIRRVLLRSGRSSKGRTPRATMAPERSGAGSCQIESPLGGSEP